MCQRFSTEITSRIQNKAELWMDDVRFNQIIAGGVIQIRLETHMRYIQSEVFQIQLYIAILSLFILYHINKIKSTLDLG